MFAKMKKTVSWINVHIGQQLEKMNRTLSNLSKYDWKVKTHKRCLANMCRTFKLSVYELSPWDTNSNFHRKKIENRTILWQKFVFFSFFSHRINDTLFKVTTFDRYSLIQYINSWMGKMYGNWRFKQWNTKIFQKFTSQADFYSPERSYAASSYVGPAKIQWKKENKTKVWRK